MKLQIIVIIMVSSFTLGCSTIMGQKVQTEFNPEKIMKQAYSEVNINDGINKDEVKKLANAYFHSYISGCGGVFEIIDQENKWEAKTLFGYAAAPYYSIFIEKITGRITCEKGPTIEPSKILENNIE